MEYILWKKVRRSELLKAEALLAARLLQGAEIELLPTRSYLKPRRECRSRSTIPLMIACILFWLLRTNASLLQPTNASCVSCISADTKYFATGLKHFVLYGLTMGRCKRAEGFRKFLAIFCILHSP
jgi:hypothetical protein